MPATEPAPLADRANVPVIINDNAWYLHVPPSHEGPVELRRVLYPGIVMDTETGAQLSFDYANDTATINEWPKRDGKTVLVARWLVADWTDRFKMFDEQDKTQRPPEGGTLFVGSSTIVGWDLDKYFPGLNAINRGFGGSQFIDAIYYCDRVVTQYKPKTIVIYDGDNDITEQQSPQLVAANFEMLVRKIRDRLPESKLIVLSIKPSMSRWNVWGKMQEANTLIADIASKYSDVQYVDISGALLSSDGQPRKELFGPDELHLNADGYEAISAVLRPLLMPAK